MQYLDVSCAVRGFFKSLAFKGLMDKMRSNIPHTEDCLKEKH